MKRIMIMAFSVLESILLLTGCMQNEVVLREQFKDEKTSYEVVDLTGKDYEQKAQETLNVATKFDEIYTSMQQAGKDIDQRVLMEKLGEKGYIVKDVIDQYNTVNAKALEAFCNCMTSKQSADVTVYEIDGAKTFNRIDLAFLNEQLRVTRTVVTWDDQNHASISFMKAFNAYDWYYSGLGYLMYERYLWDGYDGPQGFYDIRVKPTDETYWDLCQKYIEPISYDSNNLFLVDWDEDHLDRLGFLDLFEKLYPLSYQKEMPFDRYQEGIDQEEFEQLITSYFNIDTNLLEQKPYYDAAKRKYLWHERQVNESTSQRMAQPRVIGYKESEDGTFTLTVGAFWPARRSDCGFKSEVTICPLKDGHFKYISNHVIPSKANLIPEYIPRENESFN